MAIYQLSVFMENKPGQLRLPLDALAAAGLNLRAVSLGESDEYGILRFIVADAARAQAVLAEAGCTVNRAEVVAVEMADAPGALAAVIDALDGLNVAYLYTFAHSSGGTVALVLKFDEPAAALARLAAAGIRVLTAEELLGG